MLPFPSPPFSLPARERFRSFLLLGANGAFLCQRARGSRPTFEGGSAAPSGDANFVRRRRIYFQQRARGSRSTFTLPFGFCSGPEPVERQRSSDLMIRLRRIANSLIELVHEPTSNVAEDQRVVILSGLVSNSPGIAAG